jgi:K+-dependent Na+/Ca+ exchanger-like protein
LFFFILSLLHKHSPEGGQDREQSIHRRLAESDDEVDCDALEKADPEWFAAIYFIGVLYTFIAIAVVCDELFVPALEEIASDRHMNLSMDVAGATLMAAGGSAPELFTSFFGTFVQESEVGIGTVVGSAVFNVLFVIAMCALLTKEVLALTWWPLFRDSVCYSLGLIMLGLFVGVISPGKIELWEAIVLFCTYLGYVTIMYFNRRLYKMITGKAFTYHQEPAPAVDTENKEEKNENGHEIEEEILVGDNIEAPKAFDSDAPSSTPSSHNRRRSMRRGPSLRSLDDIKFAVPAGMKSIREEDNGKAPWPGTFRSGVLKILHNPNSLKESAGVGIVAVMAGDVHNVFSQVDVDDSGDIDREELAHLFAQLECSISVNELDTIMEELDENKDGKITEDDFVTWYIRSEEHISTRTHKVFDFFDTEKSGKITRENLKRLLITIESSTTDGDVNLAMSAMHQSGSKDEISFEEFSDWYNHSMIHQRQNEGTEEDENGIFESLSPPDVEKSGFFSCALDYIKYFVVLPIVFVLAFTVPDVRRPGMSKYCYLSFVLSIIWIGVFSYYMVDWAETIGHTIGIPSVIMGLTLLAAGTSVPDLLTSVIVAKMGEGDMALSSSIGSNIFDILVGLPVPWIAYSALNDTSITVRMRTCIVLLNTRA